MDRHSRDDMGQQRARGVELLALDDCLITLDAEGGLEGGDVLAVQLGKRVTPI